jgi:hypothetical protein
MMWQHNVYYVCVTFSVVQHTTSRTHNKRYAATSPRLTSKNFKLSDFFKIQ